MFHHHLGYLGNIFVIFSKHQTYANLSNWISIGYNFIDLQNSIPLIYWLLREKQMEAARVGETRDRQEGWFIEELSLGMGEQGKKGPWLVVGYMLGMKYMLPSY